MFNDSFDPFREKTAAEIRRDKIKAEVKATILRFMTEAERQGLDPFDAAEAEFRGVPEGVLYACLSDLGRQQEARWWDSLITTIDSEVIRNAIETEGKR